jgi:hypothetical protein
MTLSGAGIVLTWLSLNGANPSLLALAGGLAVFGAGLGLYIAPNNTATIAAAGKGRTGEAGGLLSLTRVLGSMAGVVTASTSLSWRLHTRTGSGAGTLATPGHTVVEAVQDALWVLLLFAITAGCAGLFRTPNPETPLEHKA